MLVNGELDKYTRKSKVAVPLLVLSQMLAVLTALTVAPCRTAELTPVETIFVDLLPPVGSKTSVELLVNVVFTAIQGEVASSSLRSSKFVLASSTSRPRLSLVVGE
jgi:hypothetical protein